jgi:mannose-6-phosphate isomerase-like protein (cupin superfamily)
MRPHSSTLITGALAVGLAAGWGLREAHFAQAQGKRVPSTTVNAADVKAQDAQFEGKNTGKAAVYLDGETAGNRSLQVGRFLLNPGAEPHRPHKHVEEELLIVSRGQGEIYCDGKTYPVRAGSVMFTDPNVEHGIKNTGERPIEFYWVKYVPKGER